MKRLFALLMVVLAVLALSSGCNGANEISGTGQGRQARTPVPTPQVTPRRTPNRCTGKLQQRCDDRQERSTS